MLSTTVVHARPHCGGEHLQKNGHTNHGAQRAKCVDCRRTFTLVPKGPRYFPECKDQVLSAYQDRMSLRGIGCTFDVCYETVMAWLGEKAEQLPAFVDTLLPGQNGDVLELDELLELCGQQGLSALAVGGLMSAHPPDRGLDARGQMILLRF